MGKGAKIAIGCAIAAVAVVVLGIGSIVGLGWWAKNKAEKAMGGSFESIAETQKKIAEFEAKAESNPFSRPADRVIGEDRLVKFLGVRKAVYAVYERHRPEIEALSKKKDAGISDGLGAFGWLNEARLAQAQALADQGMNPDEYRFMVEVVYHTLVASEIAKSAGTETATEAIQKAQKESETALRKAAEDARAQGVDLGEGTKQWKEASEGLSEMAQGAQAMDVPKENIALFRKYEAEIKKYSMGGLEFAGL